ncbi:Hypothetical predicted protein [Scomber scombrus]|uniref:Uncharacterized protein n=1 Tax=Scomber scombrus TaxID=13677 RepID=A0AAV1Q5F4_SCOSC
MKLELFGVSAAQRGEVCRGKKCDSTHLLHRSSCGSRARRTERTNRGWGRSYSAAERSELPLDGSGKPALLLRDAANETSKEKLQIFPASIIATYNAIHSLSQQEV